MSDTKDDVVCFGPRPGRSPVSERATAPADFKKWARRDKWHIAEGAMLILGFEPFKITADWWPKPEAPGFADIYETARRSGGLLAEGDWVSPRDFLAWAREKEYMEALGMVPRQVGEESLWAGPRMPLEALTARRQAVQAAEAVA